MRVAGFLLIGFGIGGWNAETANFDLAKPGQIAPGWTSAMTHRGGAPRWEVHPDATAPSGPNVLAQVSTSAGKYRFPLAIFDKVVCKNGDLSVKLKLGDGKYEQAAGLVLRYQDENNYYVVRVNAAEDNIVLFRLKDGKPQSIAPMGTKAETFGVKHAISPEEWNTLKIAFRENHFTVYFDHRRVFDAEDGTFLQPGKTGLWTKGDTVAYFDDFRIDKKN